MQLNQIADNDGARKSRTRVGRGIGCGKGKTCGRGHKGQKSRTGVAIKGFEGGQMPIHRRLPKRGFRNIFSQSWATVNLDEIQRAVDAKRLDAAKTVGVKELIAAGIIRASDSKAVKLLGDGELKSKVTLVINKASKSALEKVEKAGGKVTIEALPEPLKTDKKSIVARGGKVGEKATGGKAASGKAKGGKAAAAAGKAAKKAAGSKATAETPAAK